MRLIHILIITGCLSAVSLWLGYFGCLKKRIALFVSLMLLGCSGFLLLMGVLPQNSFYGHTIVKAETDRKIVALTFDDGPYGPYTQELLQVLENKNVKATFFMVGDNAFNNQQLVRLVNAKGHEIALHAGKHRDFLKLGPEALAADIESGKATLEWLTGEKVKYIRPPHGFRDWNVMQQIRLAGLQAVNWSVIPRDWTNPGADVIADRVCGNIFPGAIVLLHDGDSPARKASREQTVKATAMIIDRLRQDGYEFVTVSQLLENKEK